MMLSYEVFRYAQDTPVNLKLVKRQMYGRDKIDLLRARTIHSG